MANQPGILHRIFTGSWTLVDQGRRTIVNLIFLFLIYFIIKVAFFTESAVVPSGAALVLKPVGYIVDELNYVKPVDQMIDNLSEENRKEPQTLLKDLLTAIDEARKDKAINALVLNLSSFYGAGPSKLQDLALAIESFKTSGKPVYAYSEFYNQSQYYLASNADEVYMDPLGTLWIEGYGRFNTYFKDALDKLGVNYHIFKVGTYKSAVEPFTRNNMSDNAKEANLHYLGDLWQSYVEDIAKARNISVDDVRLYSSSFLENVSTLNKNTSSLALDASLIDELMSRQEMIAKLTDKLGANKKGNNFKQISHSAYLKILKGPLELPDTSSEKVAVIVAKGVIYNGTKKAGSIGGDSTAKLIRRARLNKKIKAVVIRVDSPGGSAYASEIIRREIVKTRNAGKPVVISMGSYAASGGYWISASADEIWASPTTITGSIGIFGMLPTFEQPLNKLGIHRDGIGTTNLSGAFDVGKALRVDVQNAIQSSIETGYDRFLTIVAEGRNMSKEDVNKIAQGRVWSGKSAHELGLVDHLGGLDKAIESAANKASLMSYDIKYIQHEISASEKFMNNLLNSRVAINLFDNVSIRETNQVISLSPVVLLLEDLQDSYEKLVGMNDPQNLYAHCLCSVR